ncbi:hypothetical protein [Photorhabdus bodei]|uniref:MFS transporter n=1 Tax=Photorhabdus bodei TaxID=2029681 RepID=A0A329XAG2_9GAMM|nr:hypothetical protein [Photorhabdus bodei]NDL00801.1 hypothetical protein [Photorhabdus bodei]NDL04967.1 hypothetical protein [Photorhabdus bodei]NDL09300.1 hypothetical protein [Photorhabdus bodei]RAX13586.1 hypothetical protein CKY02_05575 [Photorhabdus bodei]
MILALFKALAGKPWLLLLGLSFVVSSIGNGITYIVVFSELVRLSAPTTSLALAYVLSTVPGLIGSKVGEHYCRTGNPFSILIVGECLGMAGLAAPFLAVVSGSIPLFLIAQTVSAFTIGMTFPAMSKIFKTGLTEKELPIATTLETIIFACNVIFGVGLGLLLLGHVTVIHLLVIDLASFALSLMILGWSRARFTRTFHYITQADASIEWRVLTSTQRRGILLLPLLAFAGAPAMALLPSLVPLSLTGHEAQTTALALLFSRSLGQLVGPLLLNPERFEKNSNSNALLIGCLFAFITCYGLVPFSSSTYLALLLVFIAHVFSNVVFSLAVYTVLKKFDENHVPAAMAKSYRLQMLITAVVSIGAGYCSQYIGVVYALYAFSGTGFMLIVMLLIAGKRMTHKSVTAGTE